MQLASHNPVDPKLARISFKFQHHKCWENKCLSGFYILGPSDLARSATTDGQRFKPRQELPNQGLAEIHSKMLR